jgi:hypothetical protein
VSDADRDVCSPGLVLFICAAAAAARYVWLGATSAFKAESDLLKYEKARKLKDYIHDIRKNYKRDWASSDVRKKQVRCCTSRHVTPPAVRIGVAVHIPHMAVVSSISCYRHRVQHP